MCERTEAAAVDVLHAHLWAWRQHGLDPRDYTDDHAIEALLARGIRPSSLSADLDWLIARARRLLEVQPCPTP